MSNAHDGKPRFTSQPPPAEVDTGWDEALLPSAAAGRATRTTAPPRAVSRTVSTVPPPDTDALDSAWTEPGGVASPAQRGAPSNPQAEVARAALRSPRLPSNTGARPAPPPASAPPRAMATSRLLAHASPTRNDALRAQTSEATTAAAPAPTVAAPAPVAAEAPAPHPAPAPRAVESRAPEPAALPEPAPQAAALPEPAPPPVELPSQPAPVSAAPRDAAPTSATQPDPATSAPPATAAATDEPPAAEPPAAGPPAVEPPAAEAPAAGPPAVEPPAAAAEPPALSTPRPSARADAPWNSSLAPSELDPPLSPATRPGWLLHAALAAGVVGGCVGLWLFLGSAAPPAEPAAPPSESPAPRAPAATRSRSTPAAVPSAGPAAPPSAEVAPSSPVGVRQVRITIEPGHARLMEKGALVGRSGTVVDVEAGRRRVFEIQCDGYSARRLVVDGQEPELRIGLVPSATAPATDGGTEAPGVAPPAPSAAPPAPAPPPAAPPAEPAAVPDAPTPP